MHSNHFGRSPRLRYQYSPSVVRGNKDQRRVRSMCGSAAPTTLIRGRIGANDA
jgi:hypothetical protein